MSWLQAGIALAGSVFGAGSSSRAQERQNRETRWQNAVDRVLFERDRTYSENYEAERRADDRAYVNRQIHNDRDYQRRQTQDNRAYERRQTQDERRFNVNEYNRTVTNDRQYLESNRVRDQRNLDIAERRRVNSRGVDLAKLRQDAVAAGFNPLSVMGMAGMYSTELNQQVVGSGGLSGGVGTGRSTPAAGGGGGGGGSYGGGSFGGGGTTGAASAGMVGPTGNVRNFDPSLSSGGFLADAVARGVDTVFNQPEQQDPLADALRKALQTDTIVQDHKSKDIRQDFGYDLQNQQTYRPNVNVSGPPMSTGTAQQARVNAGQPAPSDDMVTPAQQALTYNRGAFKPSGDFSDAEAAESRYGEIAGEFFGLSSLASDAGSAFREFTDRKGITRRKPKLSQSARPRIRPGSSVPDGYGGYYW